MVMRVKIDFKFLIINGNWYYISERILIGCKIENKLLISYELNEL